MTHNDIPQSAASALFRTVVRIAPLRTRIGHANRILSLGSCFADNMARRMQRAKFHVTASPTGILFNPESVARAIEAFDRGGTASGGNTGLPQGVRGVQYASGRYFSYDFHSSFSSEYEAVALGNMKKAIAEGAAALQKADTLVITFGTAWIYRLCSDGEAVANCHKQPQSLFSRELLSAERITDRYDALLTGPLCGKRVILTVSPVRHLGDGLDGNSLSKAILRVAAAEICRRHAQAEYFPSYEILNDELRDYRFYADDMTHPSAAAVDYIWQRFAEAAFDERTRRAAAAAERIAEAAEHRPFNPASEEYRTFCRTMLARIDSLRSECPDMDLECEQTLFAARLG